MAVQIHNDTDLFDMYFRRADLDGDGRINGQEAVSFFKGFNLPQNVLAQVWTYADHKGSGFLGRSEFYNALRLVTVAQSKRELTPDIVKAALLGSAASKIPAPQINFADTPGPQFNPRAATSHNMAIRAPQILASSSHLYTSHQQNQLARPFQGMPQVTASSSPHVAFGQGNHPGGPSQGVPHVIFSSPQQEVIGQVNHLVRPSKGISQVIASSQQQGAIGQGMPGGANASLCPQSSSLSTDWFSGTMLSSPLGDPSQVTSTGISPSVTNSVLTPSVQPKALETSELITSAVPKPQDLIPSYKMENKDVKASVVSGNALMFGSIIGDVSSGASSQQKQETPSHRLSASNFLASPAIIRASSAPQHLVRPRQPKSLHSEFTTHHPETNQLQKLHSTIKQSRHVPGQSTIASASSGFSLGSGDSSSSQSQISWPKMTQLNVQKYTKVFVEVDTDRTGKLTGEQARNLFLSWRLPREVLKQVWDLSDQDNDSMLSLREFCIALYLMERFRENHPLPTVLPNSVMYDEVLLHTTGQPTLIVYGNTVWKQSQGATGQPTPSLQQLQGVIVSQSVTPATAVRQPSQIHSLRAEPEILPSQPKSKVPVLEKHLVDQLSKEEQNSLNSKFQEAREADKKVQELEKEILDSKQKIEFYTTKMQEIILYKSKCDNQLSETFEKTSTDKHEVDLLVKKYEEKYKQAGDIASKLTIDEATFHDIQERKMNLYQAIVKMEQIENVDGTLQAHADHIQSDLEELMKTMNERCKKYGLHVKPTTLVELPFGWQPGIQEGAADWDESWDRLEDEGFTFVKELTLDVQNIIAPPRERSSLVCKGATSADVDLTAASSLNTDTRSDMLSWKYEPENGLADFGGKNSPENNSPRSPTENAVLGSSPSHELKEAQSKKIAEIDASPHIRDAFSDHGGDESVVSGDKFFEEPSWGTFDTQYVTDSVWGFDQTDTNESENSFFDSGPVGLNPIRTNSFQTDETFQKQSPFNFADSVPTTPNLNFANSPYTSDDRSFNAFSRFDSSGTNDGRVFPLHNSFSRFDSMRSSRDFDEVDLFGTTDHFRASLDGQTSRYSDADLFGSSEIFRLSLDTQAPGGSNADSFESGGIFKNQRQASSDNWSAF